MRLKSTPIDSVFLRARRTETLRATELLVSNNRPSDLDAIASCTQVHKDAGTRLPTLLATLAVSSFSPDISTNPLRPASYSDRSVVVCHPTVRFRANEPRRRPSPAPTTNSYPALGPRQPSKRCHSKARAPSRPPRSPVWPGLELININNTRRSRCLAHSTHACLRSAQQQPAQHRIPAGYLRCLGLRVLRCPSFAERAPRATDKHPVRDPSPRPFSQQPQQGLAPADPRRRNKAAPCVFLTDIKDPAPAFVASPHFHLP